MEGYNDPRPSRFSIIIFVIFTLFFDTFPQKSFANDIISLDEAINDNMINNFLVNQEGFMWMSSENGLHRYDGYEITTPKPPEIKNYFHKNMEILFEDKYGNIWLNSAFKGLTKYDVTYERFYHYPILHENKQPVINQTKYHKETGNIWIATEDGLYLFDNLTKKSERIEEKNMPLQQNFTAMEIDTAGNIWLGSNHGLYIYHQQKKEFLRFNTDPTDWSTITMDRVLSFARDQHGTMWIGTMWGINKTMLQSKDDLKTLSFQRIIPFPEDNRFNFVRTITPHPSGDIWITNNKCVFRMTPKNEKEYTFTRYLSYNDHKEYQTGRISKPVSDSDHNPYFLYNGHERGVYSFNYDDQVLERVDIDFSDLLDAEKQFRLRSYYIDDLDVLWVAIEKKGFLRYNLRQKAFEVMLEAKDVYGITMDPEGNLFAGTRSGINILNHETKRWRMINKQNNQSMINSFAGTLKWIGENKIATGFWDGQMSIYDIQENHFQNYEFRPEDKKSLHIWSVRDIHKDENGDLWVGGTTRGLGLLAKHKNSFTYFQQKEKKTQNYPERWVMTIKDDHHGNLWLGGRENGLYKFHKKDSTFTNFPVLDTLDNKISFEVSDLLIQNDTILWVSTRGFGLLKFNMKTEKYEFPEFRNQNIHPVINSLAEDNAGDLWMGTGNGLYHYNPKSGKVRSFYTADGLPSTKFNMGAAYSCKDDQIFFGTANGLVSFQPKQIVTQPFNPSISITNLYIFNEKVLIDSVYNKLTILKKSITHTDTLVLNHHHKMISIDFATCYSPDPQQVKYFYQLAGFDDHWREVSSQSRRATFTNLQPGHYQFKVKVSNAHGETSSAIRKIHIHVLTPWYQTIWLKLGIILFVILATILVYRIRFFQLKKQQRILERKVYLRTKEIKEVNKTLVQQKDQITHQKNILETQANQLKEADYMKTRFFINISHELKTPLTLMISPLESLIRKTKDQQQQKYLYLINKNTKRLVQLINQLLDIRKMESGNKSLELAQGNIFNFLQQTTYLFSQSAKDKNITLEYKPEQSEQNRIWFDIDIMDKIIHNLLSNAVKYTPENESITLKTKIHNHKFLQIIITNTGIGIDEENKKDVFVRFFHHDPQKENIGYGIGLSYVKDLVELYNGSIKIESEPKKYTSFIVLIPIDPALIPSAVINKNLLPEKNHHDDQLHKPATKIKDLIVTPSTGECKPTLLLVEDNSELLHYLAEEMSEFYHIYTSGNGKEGIETAMKIIPDIIISDIMMPLTSGSEMCKNLKTDVRTSHIPIILLTAKSTTEEQIEGLNTGADDYITKPFNIEVLKAKSLSLLQNRKLLAENIISPFAIRKPAINKIDQEFLAKIRQIIAQHIFDPDFGYDLLYEKLHMSKSNFTRKIKALTGKTPSEYVLLERMKKAAEMLSSQNYQVSQLAYEMGYNSPSNFSRDFKKIFSKAPKEFL